MQSQFQGLKAGRFQARVKLAPPYRGEAGEECLVPRGVAPKALRNRFQVESKRKQSQVQGLKAGRVQARVELAPPHRFQVESKRKQSQAQGLKAGRFQAMG